MVHRNLVQTVTYLINISYQTHALRTILSTNNKTKNITFIDAVTGKPAQGTT